MRDTYPLRLFGSLTLLVLGAALATIVAVRLGGQVGGVLQIIGLAIAGAGLAVLVLTMIRPRHPDHEPTDVP